MRDKLILSGIAIVLVLVSFLVLSTAGHSTTVSTNTDAEEWPSFVAYYHEKGPLSFIAAEGVGEQTFELDYTDATHWTRTILSSTVEGAKGATAILDSDTLTEIQFTITDIRKVEPNYMPNEWLSYLYISNLQKKPTVVLYEDPTSGETTAVETFERPCFAVATFAGIKKCEEGQKNSVVVREFTYRTADYIVTNLVSKVDGAIVEEVTLEKLTFK